MDDEDFAERGCGITGPAAPTYEEAVALWNRRAPVTVSEAAGEAERAVWVEVIEDWIGYEVSDGIIEWAAAIRARGETK